VRKVRAERELPKTLNPPIINKTMYKIPTYEKTQIDTTINNMDGETIEQKVTRLVQNKEPIKDGSPIIYTDRKEGVNPAYHVRTDRWEIAIDALDRLTKSKQAKRDDLYKKDKEEGKETKVIDIDGKTESTHGKVS